MSVRRTGLETSALSERAVPQQSSSEIFVCALSGTALPLHQIAHDEVATAEKRFPKKAVDYYSTM